MEAIAFRLHIRSVSAWKGLTTSTGRRVIEAALLLVALVCFVSLFYLNGLYAVVPVHYDANMETEAQRNCFKEGLQQQGVDLYAVSNLTSVNQFPVVRVHIADDSMLTGSIIEHKEQLYAHFRAWASKREHVGDNHKIYDFDNGPYNGGDDSSKGIWGNIISKNVSLEALLGDCLSPSPRSMVPGSAHRCIGQI